MSSKVMMVKTVIILLLILRLDIGSGASRLPPSRIARTKYGALRGFVTNLPNLRPVEIFLGIPYASPPVGKLRFMPPVTPSHWSGVRTANSHGPVCPQKLPDISNETLALRTMTNGRLNVLKRLLPQLQNQSEDCLYLNIHAPATTAGRDSSSHSSNQQQKLPVLMFIHGESFEWNSGSSYDGSVLSSFTNIVVVTINFRLGVLGFFPALDGSSRGNFGLMDQVAALHWIQENIHEFGGDASNVTIFGHGTGAACVNLLMLSPMAKGLFHRAIMASGSALSSWAMATDAVKYSRKLAAKLGCPDEPDKNSIMIDCLRQKSAHDLVMTDFDAPKFLSNLGPTVDGIVVQNDPSSLMESFNSFFGNYDLMFGFNQVEFYDFNQADERRGIDSSRKDKILRTLIRNLFTYHLQEIHLTISNEYTDWTKSTSNTHPTDTLESLIEVLGDATIIAPLIKTGSIHSRLQRNTYLYELTHGTERGDYPSHLGSIKGDDLAYILGAPLLTAGSDSSPLGYFTTLYTKQESVLSELIMTYFGNFIRTGNPNLDLNGPGHSSSWPSSSNVPSLSSSGIGPPSTSGTSISTKSVTLDPRVEKVPWPQFEEKQQQYLSISLKPKVKDHYRSHRLSYWLNLIPKLHVPGPNPVSSLDSSSGGSSITGDGTSVSGFEHHLLSDHDDPNTYEGLVRESNLVRIKKLIESQATISANGTTTLLKNSSTAPSSSLDPKGVRIEQQQESPSSSKVSSKSASSNQVILNQSSSGKKQDLSGNPNGLNNPKTTNASSVFMVDVQNGSYTSAISAIVGIGVCLLVLNLIIAAMYFKRIHQRQSSSHGNNGGSQLGGSENQHSLHSHINRHSHLHHHHPSQNTHSSHSRHVHLGSNSNQQKHSTSNSNNSNTSSLDHPSNNEMDQLALISSTTKSAPGQQHQLSLSSPLPDIRSSIADCINGPLPTLVGVDLMNTYSTTCQRNSGIYSGRDPSFDLVPISVSNSDQISPSPLNTPTPPVHQLPTTSIGNHTSNYLTSSYTGRVSMIDPSSGKIYGSTGRSSGTSLANHLLYQSSNQSHQQQQHFHSTLTTYDTLNSSDTSGFIDVGTETSSNTSQQSHQQSQKQQLQLNHQHLYSHQEGSI